MSGAARLTGTVWHPEILGRQEGDDRRHRSRCVNYNGKTTGKCSYYGEKCHGAAHCSHYSEETVINDEVKNTQVHKVQAVSFKGIKDIKMSDVDIDKKFIDRPPKEKKIEELIEYYKNNGELDKPIIVGISNGKYKLKDKYLRYVVAKRLGLDIIPAEMGTEEELKERENIRKVGCLVWHKQNSEVGEVINVTLKKITIKYDDGRELTYDIHACLESGNIRVL